MSCADNQLVISSHDLFGFLFDYQTEGKHLAMLYSACIDDSADERQERIVVSGAIIGNEKEWAPFNKPWKERLAQDDLDYFKSSQCDSLNGQFHKFRKLPDGRIRADKVRNDLDAIIHRTSVVTLGIMLPIPFFKKMQANPSKYGSLPKIPYQLAFQQTLAECGKVMTLLGREHIVTFAHDDGDDFPELHRIYKEFKKLNPRYGKVMMDFVPLDDKVHPPVQGADVSASITRRFAEDWAINPTRDNLKRLRGSVFKLSGWREGEPSAHDDDLSPARVSYVV